MVKSLKKKLLIAGGIGLMTGLLFFLIYFSFAAFAPLNTPEWTIEIFLFTIGLPFLLTGIIASYLGYGTMGYIYQGVILSIPIYFGISILTYYLYLRIKKIFK